MAAAAPSGSRFVKRPHARPPSSTADLAGPPLVDEDWVVLSIVHSAQGGECAVVHVLHASDGTFPSDMATGDPEGIEEERRLLYVAVTWARSVLAVDPCSPTCGDDRSLAWPDVTATTFVDWPAARAAVAEAAPRLTAMLRTLPTTDAPALGEWDVTQLAAHVSHAMDTIAAMANGGGNILEDISGLAPLTKAMVQGEGRRPLADLADRIDASAAAFLAAMEAAGDDRSVAWFTQGSRLPLSALTCHMLNDLTVHGYDIARAAGRPWPIDRGHASLIVMGFLFPALDTLGRSVVVQEKAADVRARFEVRLRGDGRAWLRFDNGDFSVEGWPQGRVDCHLSVDPAAFLLVAWGRISQWQAIPRGQLVAWGRRPWLGLRLRSWLRNP